VNALAPRVAVVPWFAPVSAQPRLNFFDTASPASPSVLEAS
jgi:hypothetical protein